MNYKTLEKKTIFLSLIAMGACSVKSSTNIPPINPISTPTYGCMSDDNQQVGVFNLGGFLNVYKNKVLQFNSHHGYDLSFFFTDHEPTPEDNFLKGSAIPTNVPDSAVEEYNLSLNMNLTTGSLEIEEIRYTRTDASAPWVFASSQIALHGSSCHKL
jgi:hypothetical protein